MPHDRRSVLVTGAGSGIGRALAIEAGQRGMRVALNGRRRAKLVDTADLLQGRGDALILDADITLDEERGRLVARIRDEWGGLDILVNNAGLVVGGPLESLSEAMIDRVFQTNVVAPMCLTRDLLPLLRESPSAHIVNIGSMFGDISYPGFVTYSASKFALRGFSDGLRRELKRTGIKVTYAAPRATRTDAAVAFGDLLSRSKMRLDDPKEVAWRIWEAVSACRDRVYPDGPERFYVFIERLLPTLISRSLSRQNA